MGGGVSGSWCETRGNVETLTMLVSIQGHADKLLIVELSTFPLLAALSGQTINSLCLLGCWYAAKLAGIQVEGGCVGV